MRIRPVGSAADLAATVLLFEAYAASLAVDLGYQGFAAEMAGLPGMYGPPAGALLLARDRHGAPLGCVALRPMAAEECGEIKRLYVLPSARGLGVGRALLDAVLGEAKRIGYREVRLDSLPDMAAAMALYLEAGFREIAPYYDTPVAGTRFFARPIQG